MSSPRRRGSFFIFIIMKFVRNIILALALLLPGCSLAQADSVYTPKKKSSDYIPLPLGLEVGGGNMFVAGLEWWILPTMLIGAQERPNDIKGLWVPNYALIWSFRTRYVYDYIDHEHGILLYPNIQCLFVGLTGIAVGPQVGWFSSTGFDYGASVRFDLLSLLNIEVGYFAKKENVFVNIIFTMSGPRTMIFDP